MTLIVFQASRNSQRENAYESKSTCREHGTDTAMVYEGVLENICGTFGRWSATLLPANFPRSFPRNFVEKIPPAILPVIPPPKISPVVNPVIPP